jgi:hypothetical protein
MITQEQLNEIAYALGDNFEKVNIKYITLMADHLSKIGELSADDVHLLNQLAKYGVNVKKINKEFAHELNITLDQMDKLYDKIAKDSYETVSEYYRINGVTQVPLEENKLLNDYVNSMKILTAGTFTNLAKTTVMSQSYKNAVDEAIRMVSTGASNYKDQIDNLIMKEVSNGMRVQYASGLTRRLDSAARMNVLDGVRQMNIGVNSRIGEQFGSDGVEVSVHALCALDHIPVQGRQYSKKEWAQVSAGLDRQIGELNCHHFLFPIILGVSEPTYSDSELKKMNDLAQKKITVNGKTMTRYEASQYMRRTETAMRGTKEKILSAREIGNAKLEQHYTNLLKKQSGLYANITKQSGLTPRWERSTIPEFNAKPTLNETKLIKNK